MDKLYYKEYYTLERSHWWFKARLEILESFVRKMRFAPERPPAILNAGAATGATSVMLKRYGEVTSLEYDRDCAAFLEEILGEEVLRDSFTELSLRDDSVDLVCAFDVIEHIDEHREAVREAHRVLRDGGRLFLTVPAFQSLWSEHDEINHHFRRYRLGELVSLLRDNGFVVEYASYLNFVLFAPIAAVRFAAKLLPKRATAASTGSDFERFESKLLDKVLYGVFKAEQVFFDRGWRLPFGVSAMAIASKQG